MRLPEPEDTRWEPAREKVWRMLARADVARRVTPLDLRDLRGWHYVLTGGILGCLSPWGFDAGMTGRWDHVADSPGDRAAWTPTKSCAGSPGPLRPQALANGTAGGSAASASTSPTRARRLAVVSPELSHRSWLGPVLHAEPAGTCLAESAFAPQTADTDGDFVQGVLTEGQDE
jgi:hypothetical protein